MQKTAVLYVVLLTFFLNACRPSKTMLSATKSTTTAKGILEKQEREFIDAEGIRLLGDHKKALARYKSFVSNYPQNATGHYILGRLYFMNNEVNLAEAQAKKACDLQPSNIYFKEFYTQTLVYQNKEKEAEAQLNNLVKTNPENEEYVYRKAMLDLKNKRYDNAIENLNTYEKLTGFNEEISTHRKNIYLQQKRYPEAIAEIRKLQEFDSHNIDYQIMLADVYDDLKQKDSVQMIYNHIERNFKDEPLAQVALAQYFLDQKDKAKYNYFMQEVMKNKNLSPEIKIALILPSLRNIDTDSSVVEKNRLTELAKAIYVESPNNKDATILYADVLYYSQKNQEALSVYKEYILLDQTKLNPYLQIMSLSFDTQQYDSTISYGRQCIQLFNDNPLPYFYQGIAYSQLKQTDSCIVYLNKALTMKGIEENLRVQILSGLGDAYNTKKQYPQSDSVFDAALALTQSDASILNNYAYYLSVRNVRLDDAERMSKRSLELQPGSKSFLDTYGWIMYQQGKYLLAKEYIEKAIKANGENDGTLFEHLGDVYFKLNDKEKALYNWIQAKNKGEHSEELIKKINSQKLHE